MSTVQVEGSLQAALSSVHSTCHHQWGARHVAGVFPPACFCSIRRIEGARPLTSLHGLASILWPALFVWRALRSLPAIILRPACVWRASSVLPVLCGRNTDGQITTLRQSNGILARHLACTVWKTSFCPSIAGRRYRYTLRIFPTLFTKYLGA